eukprot:TRINITY_DN1434_c1_g1_i1.p1 TRINITY_DN1434_c1_g1~~TRINITY_DN1434_c1_g1_i1.p1  ORF type:complete len:272 (+),score=73.87 TRINITY_DN1434_c1_g1_i1:30-818(+)
MASIVLGKDSRMGSPEPGEVAASLEGSSAARLAAVLAVLAKVDAHGPSASPAPARPVQAAAAPAMQSSESRMPAAASAPVVQSSVPEVLEPPQLLKQPELAQPQESSEQRQAPEERPMMAASPQQPKLEPEKSQAQLIQQQVECTPAAVQPQLNQYPTLAPSFDSFGSMHSLQSFAPQLGLGLAHPMLSVRSQLHLILPAAIVRGPLVKFGHLAEIARSCNVQIDLCDEICPNQLHVVVSGTCATNTMASLALQWRVFFACG